MRYPHWCPSHTVRTNVLASPRVPRRDFGPATGLSLSASRETLPHTTNQRREIRVPRTDTEIWLLFAPFWILGIAALIGSVWHMAHAAIVTRRAQAAGHVRKASLFSKRLAWHELTDDGRRHLRLRLIAFAAFLALRLLGGGVGAAVGPVLLGR